MSKLIRDIFISKSSTGDLKEKVNFSFGDTSENS